MTDTSHFAEIKDLPDVGEEELTQFTQIVDKLPVDQDLRAKRDGYNEMIEALIKSIIQCMYWYQVSPLLFSSHSSDSFDSIFATIPISAKEVNAANESKQS